jgi:hypothetical protein
MENSMTKLIEELSIVELEQRVEFCCFDCDSGGGGGTTGGGGGGGTCTTVDPCQQP